MCGVFGFISEGGRKPNMERLRRIAKVTERRGPHAFGFAWIDARGRLRSYKQTGRISDHLPLLSMAADARLLIGHTRFATMGDPANNLNNHPHASDGGWIVHNGQIPNYAELLEEHDLHPVTGCDSEALALLVERLEGTLAERCADAVNAIATGSPAVLLGLWKGSGGGRLVAVRRGNPLHLGRAGAGVYLASLAEGLPQASRVVDGNVIEFRINGEGAIHVTQSSIERREEHEASGAADVRARGAERDRAVPVHGDAEGSYRAGSQRRWGF